MPLPGPRRAIPPVRPAARIVAGTITVLAAVAIAPAPGPVPAGAAANGVITPVGALPAASPALDIAYAGGHAYVAAHARGVHIVDVADPARPRLVGTAATAGAAYDVAVVGDRLYVAAWSAGLEVHDISDPAAPASSARRRRAPTRRPWRSETAWRTSATGRRWSTGRTPSSASWRWT